MKFTPLIRVQRISVANQKGSVGKSTSVYNLGTCLALDGKKVLMLETDPQGRFRHFGVPSFFIDLATCGEADGYVWA